MTPLKFIAMSALYWYVVFSLFVIYNLIKALYVKFCCDISDYYYYYYPEDDFNNYNNRDNHNNYNNHNNRDNHNDNTENV